MNGLRRNSIAAIGIAVITSTVPQVRAALPIAEVWKAPTCGCCADWVKYLKSKGFDAKVHDVGNTAARQRLGMPVQYGSCHTALIGGYVVEGHVPAREIVRLLREKPKAIGLAVPGMPIGSPGMDGPGYGGRRQPYQVLLVLHDGTTVAYEAYR